MAQRQMVINYVPGEECRVAVVEDGRLEEFHAERMDGPSSHVGNIYVGKVANVEPGIQAAFVDFGLEQNGFLHVSDVHPQYFPGEDRETTERVGKKTPRRERPPIQDCFRRGDEVAVQVLKEGVGTKGPTVTSYLSIPGRFLVMMPQMDKVGVSRKVEDEEMRRKMREILDQLDLPEGFGFILRTAGFDRTKAELKRDLAYLMRLWKDMETRWRSGSGKPRLLCSESDLLVRALRDILTGEIGEIVVDNEAALNRAARFLKIVSPRTTTRLVHFTGRAPIFHAMGIEEQVRMIHAREVPLPSGGRLVIDEAEALVAIDVNSGKMRDARDAETTAYKTNLEAADEICRQLRLRDAGGVIVNDFIDMRASKHRRDVENRMKDLLKKDRARWTTASISEFGILEMTRQRMRGSHESQHFSDCPTCRGRGLVQRPESLATESLRDLAALVDNSKVHRVEMVVHPRIAGELLSSKRRTLSRIERTSGKRADVRVSEAIAVDRVTFYAYDERGADLDVASLSGPSVRQDEMRVFEIKADAADAWAEQLPDMRSEAPEPEYVEEEPVEPDAELHPIEIEPTELSDYAERGPRQGPQNVGQGPGGPFDQEQGETGEGGRRRRRRRRGRRGGRGPGEFAPGAPGADMPAGGPNDHYGPGPDQHGYAEQPYDQPHAHQGGADAGQGEYAERGGYAQDAGYAEQGGEYPAQGEPYAQQGADGYAGNEPGPGPQGAFDPNQPGEGGRRRRRRRRGRRGGRGRGDAPMNPGQPGYQNNGAPPGAYGPGPGEQGGSEQGAYDQGAYNQGQYDQGAYDQGAYAQGQYDQPPHEQGSYEQGPYSGEGPGGEWVDPNAPPPAPGDDQYAAEQEYAGEAAGYDQQNPSPQSQLPPSEGGEGGGRRRRRRRRRGGRGGHGGQDGHGGQGPVDGGPVSPEYAQGEFQSPVNDQGESPEGSEQGGYFAPDGGSGDESIADAPESIEPAQTPDDHDGPPSGDKPPRRRRRRRGGGSSGAGEASAGRESAGAPAPAPPAQAPRRGSAGPNAGRDAGHGGQRGSSPQGRASGGRGKPPAQPRVEPKPKPEPKDSGPGKPRTLYSSRRKLGPGDIKGVSKVRE